jgi:hypothetical protein
MAWHERLPPDDTPPHADPGSGGVDVGLLEVSEVACAVKSLLERVEILTGNDSNPVRKRIGSSKEMDRILTGFEMDPYWKSGKLYSTYQDGLIFVVYEMTKRLCGRKLAKISISEALKAGTE